MTKYGSWDQWRERVHKRRIADIAVDSGKGSSKEWRAIHAAQLPGNTDVISGILKTMQQDIADRRAG